jgi:hypothetical protein
VASLNVNSINSPLSLALIQKKGDKIYEAVKEESAILTKGAGFQDVSENDTVELLESNSLLLTNEELAEVDRQTYKEAMMRM